jgi:hypothetical protein
VDLAALLLGLLSFLLTVWAFIEQWRKAPSTKAIAPTGGDLMRMAIGQRQAIWKMLLANTCATVGIILAFAAH